MLILVLALFGGRRPDLARRWMAIILGMLGVMLVLKLTFGVDPRLGRPIDVESPSGHAASATLAYGGLALLLSGQLRPGLLAGGIAAILIGMSRVVLGMHSVPEVVIGSLAGLAAIWLLGSRLGERIGDASLLPAGGGVRVAGACGAVIAVMHGVHAPFEEALRQIEARLRDMRAW